MQEKSRSPRLKETLVILQNCWDLWFQEEKRKIPHKTPLLFPPLLFQDKSHYHNCTSGHCHHGQDTWLTNLKRTALTNILQQKMQRCLEGQISSFLATIRKEQACKKPYTVLKATGNITQESLSFSLLKETSYKPWEAPVPFCAITGSVHMSYTKSTRPQTGTHLSGTQYDTSPLTPIEPLGPALILLVNNWNK